MSVPVQLTLPVCLDEAASFDNWIGDSTFLDRILQDQHFVYCWSQPGGGCSHLLQAICHRSLRAGRSAYYLNPEPLLDLDPAMLDGLEQFDQILIDDIQQLSGSRDWELGLFNLFNAVADTGHQLVVGGHLPIAAVSFVLPDLASRMKTGIGLEVPVLDDDFKVLLLQDRARRRGLVLPLQVATYIMRRSPRDLRLLLNQLDLLDKASLSQHRALTIPMVKEHLQL